MREVGDHEGEEQLGMFWGNGAMKVRKLWEKGVQLDIREDGEALG